MTTESRMLGRYLVLDVLGQGGMGTVLRAYDRELERPVALKVLHRDLDDRYTQRLRREAQALAKLSHPNVVQVYEVGELDGQTFVAMELVKGQTAKAWMRQEPLARWEQALGPDHPRVAYALTQLGEALLDLGKPAEALAPLVRALAIRTTHEVDPTDLAETRFILARVRWGAPASHGRDRPHARELAEQAREAWAEAGAGNEDSLAAVDRWLAEHPAR